MHKYNRNSRLISVLTVIKRESNKYQINIASTMLFSLNKFQSKIPNLAQINQFNYHLW